MSERQEKTIREAIEEQNRRLKSDDLRRRVVESFLAYGELGRRLRGLSDRQVGQLVFDVVLDNLGLVSPVMSVCMEASERLLRSPSGARTTGRFNVPGHLPSCPQCGEEMLHCIGIDEPDYRECVSCGYKVQEGNGSRDTLCSVKEHL